MGDKLEMPNSKPMPTLAIGCYELRVSGDDGIYRAFYYLKLEERILIFHAFKKKTEKTSFIDLDQGRKNLREMLNEEK